MFRTIYIYSFITILILLLTGFYLEFFQGMHPCPLCALQRIVFGLLGIIFFIGIFCQTITKRLIVNLLAALFAMCGVVLAGRQIWLQHFPASNEAECGPGLQYIFEVLPPKEAIIKILSGGVECSQRGWEFLNLDIAEWSLIWFSIFLIVSIFLLSKPQKK